MWQCLRDTVGKTGFLVHGFGDGDVDFFSVIKVCTDFLAEFAFRDFDVVFGATFVGHQVEETIVNVNLPESACDRGRKESYQLVFSTSDSRDIHVVSRRAQIFVFLLGEDLMVKNCQIEEHTSIPTKWTLA